MIEDPRHSGFLAFLERRYRWLVALGAVVTLGAGYLASRLPLRSDFGELLPKNAPSLRELDRVKARTESLSTLLVGVEGGDWKARQRFVEKVAETLSTRLAGRVHQVDYRVTEARSFFERHKHLYLEYADLLTLRDRLARKVEDTRRRRLVIDFDDTPPYRFDTSDIEAKYKKRTSEYDRFPDGYFITPDRRFQVLMVRLGGVNLAGQSTDALVRDVRALIAELRPEEHGYRILLGGNPIIAMEEQRGVVEDVLAVSIACILLVVLSIVFYYRSVRSLVVIGAPVLVGTALAFALAYLVVGSLNSNTAFLGSIIVGNGINFPILLLARFTEERRSGMAVGDALGVAVRGSWSGTAAAAGAAAIAYGSLMVTDFRGFSQFGFIGCVGILLCWGATYLIAPALILALRRGWSAGRPAPRATHARGEWLDRFFSRRGRLVALSGGALALAALVATVLFYRDPFEYDFTKLRSRKAAHSEGEAGKVGRALDKVFAGGKFQGDGRSVVLVERAAQVPSLISAMSGKMRAAGIELETFALPDLVPADQDKKLVVLAELRNLLDKKVLGWMSGEERRKVLEYRPPDDLQRVDATTLPSVLARPFREKDGTMGRIVLIDARLDAFDGKRLIRYANLVRRTELPSGEVIAASGYHVILADILQTILDDGPLATATSLAGVLIVVLLAFRRARDRAVVVAALMTGVLWMCGVAVALEIKVNMLNFVALPITFGIGVDYAVNVYRRYLQEGAGSVGRSLWTTGSAVALCSLTTIIGYGSLLFADTRALNSFGFLAVVGEVTTLTAALVWMPSLMGRARATPAAERDAQRVSPG